MKLREAVVLFSAGGLIFPSFLSKASEACFHLCSNLTNSGVASVLFKMASIYGNRHYQQIPDQYNLKPVGYAETASLSGYGDGSYRPVSSQPSYSGGAELERLSTRDETLKKRVRLLRLISRVVSVIISGATLAPLAYTLIKYFQTRNQTIVVDGQDRTAWASGTQAWYTYVYFGVSTISFVFHAVILIAYCCGGVKKANKASTASSVWTGVLMVGHIVIWVISVAIYRYGKVPKDGRNTDLWGWTCSTTANQIQSQVKNIDYSKYCTAQVSLTPSERTRFCRFAHDLCRLHRFTPASLK